MRVLVSGTASLAAHSLSSPDMQLRMHPRRWSSAILVRPCLIRLSPTSCIPLPQAHLGVGSYRANTPRVAVPVPDSSDSQQPVHISWWRRMASGAGAAEAVARCMAAAPYADFSLHVRLNLLIYEFFQYPHKHCG